MKKTTTTPGTWKVAKWERDSCADGFEAVVTDARGHGLFIACQKGEHAKTRANAELVARASDLPEIIDELKRREASARGSALSFRRCANNMKTLDPRFSAAHASAGKANGIEAGLRQAIWLLENWKGE